MLFMSILICPPKSMFTSMSISVLEERLPPLYFLGILTETSFFLQLRDFTPFCQNIIAFQMRFVLMFCLFCCCFFFFCYNDVCKLVFYFGCAIINSRNCMVHPVDYRPFFLVGKFTCWRQSMAVVLVYNFKTKFLDQIRHWHWPNPTDGFPVNLPPLQVWPHLKVLSHMFDHFVIFRVQTNLFVMFQAHILERLWTFSGVKVGKNHCLSPGRYHSLLLHFDSFYSLI